MSRRLIESLPTIEGGGVVPGTARARRIAVPSMRGGHPRSEVLAVAMTLPEKALTQLRALQEQTLAIGEIWWIPEALANYPGGKDRFCIIVAIERPTGGAGALVHFVPGSTGKSTANTIKVTSGTCGLNEDTYFRFWWSGSIGSGALVEKGKLRGSLPPPRLPEIEAAIRASKLAQLKGLLP